MISNETPGASIPPRASTLLALVVLACGTKPHPNNSAPSPALSDMRQAQGASASHDAGRTDTRPPAGTISHTTSFDRAESPISESGAWTHVGLDWTLVKTAGGVAYGAQALAPRSKSEWYNDSYAYLSGFPANHAASGVIHLDAGIDRSCTHEVEVLLRWADSTHSARGYECNLAYDGSYSEIVRWNGPVGDFTYLARGSVPGGIHEGDTLTASIAGDRITLSINGVVRASANDSTFTTGNPGMAFFRGVSGCGSLGDFGFTRYTATSLAP